MKKLLILLTFSILSFILSPAQQYGWVKIADVLIDKVEFIDTLHGWGSGNGFYYTRDGGITWNSGTGAQIGAQQFSMYDTLTGWLAGNSSFPSGGIEKTTNGGVTWETQVFNFNEPYEGTHTFSHLRNISSGTKHNSGDTGKVAKTTNGGTTWAEKTIADSITYLGKMQFIDSLHGWILAGTANHWVILRTNTGGNSWDVYAEPQTFAAISFIDTLNGWAIGGTSAVHHTTDGGHSWQYIGFISDTLWGHCTVNTLSFVDSLNGWAFGVMFYEGDLSGAIFHTTDGGHMWSREFVTHITRGFGDGIMLDKTHGWAVGNSVFAYKLITSVPERLPDIPKTFLLRQNYPNPFNPATNIEYELKEFSNVILTIHDINGKEIQELINTTQPAGVYRILFDGSTLASGVYYYTLTTNIFSDTKQFILLK